MAAFGPRGSAAAALAAARPRAEAAGAHSMVIYFVRHAEAKHNVLEKAAVAEAVAAGATPRHADAARKAMLKRESQRDVIYDAPLSDKGVAQAAAAATNVRRAAQLRAAPELVLVSPLRRALRTAIEIFGGPEMRADGAPARGGFFSEGPSEGPVPARPPPLSITTSRTSAEGARFVAVEALREKRTGLACDERSSAAELTEQYPSVCFSDVFAANAENDEHRCFGWSGGVPPPTPHTAARDAADAFLPAFVVREGEDNAAVRARAMAFVSTLPARADVECIAVVTHKGFLRELRAGLVDDVQARVAAAAAAAADGDAAADGSDDGDAPAPLHLDFDLDDLTTNFGNAEVRVAQFSWDARGRLVSVVSRAIESVLDGEAHAAPRADPPPPLPEKAAETVDEVAALRAKVAEMEAPSPQSVPRTLDLA